MAPWTHTLWLLSGTFLLCVGDSPCHRIVSPRTFLSASFVGSAKDVPKSGLAIESDATALAEPAVVVRGASRSVALRMSSSSPGDGTKKNSKRSSGVYARPSAAIEKGSGFFVPGLEGSRVRLLFGVVVLALTYVNRIVSDGAATPVVSDSQILSESIAVVYGLLLLLQAAVEFGKELGFGAEEPSSAAPADGAASGVEAATTMAASSSSVTQTVSPKLASSDRAVDAVRWAAATFVALTSATHVLLVGTDDAGGSGEVYYSLGDFSGAVSDQKDGILAAVDTVFESKGGRVSIPSDHPASGALLPEGNRRCVLLQRVGSKTASGESSKMCLVVGSDKLLPSFTKNDLRWLGQLGEYVDQNMS